MSKILNQVTFRLLGLVYAIYFCPIVYADQVSWTESKFIRDNTEKYVKTDKFDELDALYNVLIERNNNYRGNLKTEIRTFYESLSSDIPTKDSLSFTFGGSEGSKTLTRKEQLSQFADKWLKHNPQSIAAQVLKARMLNYYAWESSGFERYSTFEKAYEMLRELAEKSPNDPEIYFSLIDAGCYLEIEREEAFGYLKKSLKINPNQRYPLRAYVYFLAPKQNGSELELLEFANQMLVDDWGGRGTSYYSMISWMIKRWAMMEVSAPFFLMHPMDYDSLKKGYERLVQECYDDKDADEDAYFYRFVAGNYCWFACQAEDKETAARLFKDMEYMKDVWGKEETFLQWKQWALLDGAYPFNSVHVAIFMHDLDQLKVLLDEGADVNQLDQLGKSPLYNALELNELEMARELLKHGASMGTPGTDDYRIYKRAVVKNKVDFVAMFMDYGAPPDLPFPVTRLKAPNWTMLGYCCYYGRTEIVKLMIDHGVDLMPSQSKTYGTLPIHQAAFRGHVECVKLLLDAGVPIDVTNKFGVETSLYYAIEYDRVNVFRYLLERGAAYPNEEKAVGLLQTAASDGATEIIKIMIQRPEYNPRIANKANYFATYFAAEGNHLEALKLLVESGMDYNQPTKSGDTPLDAAIKYASDDCIEYLKSLNAEQKTFPKYNSKPGVLNVVLP